MAKADTDELTLALNQYKLSVSATANQHIREREDLQFQIPDPAHQWDKSIVASRSAQNVAGQAIPPRPMLCVSTLDEPIQLVLNQEKAAHLGVNIHPLTEEASDDTAQVLQGLYRTIERTSRADMARSWAYDRAVKCGRGCYRILTEYDPSSSFPGDQRILIKRILYQEAVYFDPWAKEPDWSDGEFAFVVERMPYEKFKRDYPDANVATDTDGEFSDAVNQWPDWFEDGDQGRFVLVAEYFTIRHTRVMITIETPHGAVSVPDPTQKQRLVFCRKMTGSQFLEEPRQIPGEYIPLVQVLGREMQPVDGERHFLGMIRPAKDGARLTNYAASNAVEMAALEPKAPWIMAEGQDEGHKTEWQQSNIVPFPTLKYKQLDAYGMPAPAPARVQVDMSRLGPSMQLLTMGQGFVKSATSTYGPALGERSTAHRSGKAEEALQDQTTEATSGYLSNLAVAETYESTVILSMIPEVYDRPGRIVQILDENEAPQMAMLNAAHTIDPNTKRPVPAQMPTGANPATVSADQRNPIKHYDLNKGKYGVSVTIGKSSNSKLQAGNDAISQLLQADPMLMPLIGPEWMKFQDYPGAKAIENLLRKNREHTMPWLSDDPQVQAGAQVPQMHEAIQKMQEKIAEQDAIIKGKQVEGQTKLQETQMELASKKELALIQLSGQIAQTGAKIDAENTRTFVDAAENKIGKLLDLHMDGIKQLLDKSHDAATQAADHQHEAGMQARDHAHDHATIAHEAAVAPEPTNNGAGNA